MEKIVPKLICMKVIGGVDALRVFTTVAGAQGAIIKQIVGVGNPYWIWSSIPSGVVIAADFTDAPIADSDVSVNNANAAPLLASPPSVDPVDVLTYAP
jgi:hypothetical protein